MNFVNFFFGFVPLVSGSDSDVSVEHRLKCVITGGLCSCLLSLPFFAICLAFLVIYGFEVGNLLYS
jgi:Cu/Ag efflux pump CusA